MSQPPFQRLVVGKKHRDSGKKSTAKNEEGLVRKHRPGDKTPADQTAAIAALLGPPAGKLRVVAGRKAGKHDQPTLR